MIRHTLHIWLLQKVPLPPPQPSTPPPLGPLTSARALLVLKQEPCYKNTTKEKGWGLLLDTASVSQLKLNFHLFYRTGKPQTGSSESACCPDIQSMFYLTEGGTRQARVLLVKSNTVPLTVAQQRLTWARSPCTQPALPVRKESQAALVPTDKEGLAV